MKKAIIIGAKESLESVKRHWEDMGFEIVDCRDDKIFHKTIEAIWESDVLNGNIQVVENINYFYSAHGKLRITSGLFWVVIWTIEEDK